MVDMIDMVLVVGLIVHGHNFLHNCCALKSMSRTAQIYQIGHHVLFFQFSNLLSQQPFKSDTAETWPHCSGFIQLLRCRYGFIKPIADSVFQQDVYFNIKERAEPMEATDHIWVCLTM